MHLEDAGEGRQQRRQVVYRLWALSAVLTGVVVGEAVPVAAAVVATERLQLTGSFGGFVY